MLKDVHEHRDQLAIWLRPDIKKELYVHLEGFKHCRLTNRANRASPRSSKYIGGSAIFMKTKARLYKSLDREVTMTEIFKYTHTLKKNKERFANQRVADHYPYKNRVYGLGSFFADNLRTSILRHSSTSTTSRLVDPEDDVDLREQMEQHIAPNEDQMHTGGSDADGGAQTSPPRPLP
ncbi:hypothetical protein Ahy_B03g068717 [Arachis hypogaea]|uniref:Uncharacterized protein n=1 Tax=Arachis hypogaea TaxID=3818 RepID=A0A445AAN8_ARAHY|nr:hypothetical protein Ahy_B03g068717 [Arachis hypogaea]